MCTHSDAAPFVAAHAMAGHAGSPIVVVAAINATYYGSGRLAYLVAKRGELSRSFEGTSAINPLRG